MLSIDFTGTRSGNAGVGEPFAISADGRFAAFSSRATNHVANDTNSTTDLFVHDCLLRRHVWDTTFALSAPVLGNSGSSLWDLTPDGRYLIFVSTATNLVTGITFSTDPSIFQLYRQDLLSNVTSLISISHDGTGGANRSLSTFPNSFSRSISSDGRFVSFLSFATNLVTIDTRVRSDVFCRDVSSGATELITVAPTGDTSLDEGTISYSMSTNGQFFAFDTGASNVVEGLSNVLRSTQVYWRDRLAGTNALVSIAMEGGFASRDARLRAMSSDGRYVCFLTTATNILPDQSDSGINNDLFIRDMFAGETWLVTRTTNGAAGGGAQGGQFSANGSVLIFSAQTANLVPGIADANGSSVDIFAHDLDSRSNAIVSASWQGNTGANTYTADGFGRISSSGRYVLFTSTATNLLPDRSGFQRLYLRDLEAGRTLDPLRSPDFTTPSFNEARLAISDSERYIFFSLRTTLIPPSPTPI